MRAPWTIVAGVCIAMAINGAQGIVGATPKRASKPQEAQPIETTRSGGDTTVDDDSRNAFGNPEANLSQDRRTPFFTRVANTAALGHRTGRDREWAHTIPARRSRSQPG